MEVLWEQVWTAEEEMRFLRCMMGENGMRFDVINPDLENKVECMFSRYKDATDWLIEQSFTLHEQLAQQTSERRLTPREKKRLSYERDTRTVGTGQGASRRTKSQLPKIRRRQLRRRMKEYLREQLSTLHRDITDQSFRSFRAEDTPEFGEEMPLKDALDEKQKRKKDGKKTTHSRQSFPQNRFGHQRGDDLPDWLRDDEL
jgi:hypothetical protein